MDWSALFSAFGLVFVAELGDKTQLAVVAQTCKFRSGWPVFLGGSLALTATTALGAAAGRLLGTVVPPLVMRLVAAAAFVVMGLLIWREATKAQPENACPVCETDEASPRRRRWNWKAFTTTLALLFVAELGDKTQLAVLGMSSRQAAPWLVFAGGAAALVAVTGLAVLGGQQLCRLIPEKVLLRVSAGAFAVMGGLIGFGVI